VRRFVLPTCQPYDQYNIAPSAYSPLKALLGVSVLSHRPVSVTIAPILLGLPLLFLYFELLASLRWHYAVVLPLIFLVLIPNAFLIYRLFSADRIARVLLAIQSLLFVFFAGHYVQDVLLTSGDQYAMVEDAVPGRATTPGNIARALGPQASFVAGILLLYTSKSRVWFSSSIKIEGG